MECQGILVFVWLHFREEENPLSIYLVEPEKEEFVNFLRKSMNKMASLKFILGSPWQMSTHISSHH